MSIETNTNVNENNTDNNKHNNKEIIRAIYNTKDNILKSMSIKIGSIAILIVLMLIAFTGLALRSDKHIMDIIQETQHPETMIDVSGVEHYAEAYTGKIIAVSASRTGTTIDEHPILTDEAGKMWTVDKLDVDTTGKPMILWIDTMNTEDTNDDEVVAVWIATTFK